MFGSLVTNKVSSSAKKQPTGNQGHNHNKINKYINNNLKVAHPCSVLFLPFLVKLEFGKVGLF